MIDFQTCFNRVEKHIEDRYEMPVSISDVIDPNTGDFDGVSIKVDFALELDLAFYVLLHLFGHSVQWNLSAEYRRLGQDQTIPKPPEEMARIHDYERDATRYSLTLCRVAGVRPLDEIDRWVSDWFDADYAFLAHCCSRPVSAFILLLRLSNKPNITRIATPMPIPKAHQGQT